MPAQRGRVSTPSARRMRFHVNAAASTAASATSSAPTSGSQRTALQAMWLSRQSDPSPVRGRRIQAGAQDPDGWGLSGSRLDADRRGAGLAGRTGRQPPPRGSQAPRTAARPASARVCSLTPTGSGRPLRGTLQAAITSNMTEPRRRAALDMVILRPHIARTTEWADAPSCTAQRSVDYWEEWRSPSASTVNLPFIAPSNVWNLIHCAAASCTVACGPFHRGDVDPFQSAW